jgi:transcriptional regulator with XRE-family HTH domain
MHPIRQLRDTVGMTQQQLANASGTSQSAVAAYEAGRKSPTWRTVERLAQAVGCHVEVRVMPALTREDRRSIALHAAIVVRLRAHPQTVLVQARASLARMRALHPGAQPLLNEWRVLLRRPVDALAPAHLRSTVPMVSAVDVRVQQAAWIAP